MCLFNRKEVGNTFNWKDSLKDTRPAVGIIRWEPSGKTIKTENLKNQEPCALWIMTS